MGIAANVAYQMVSHRDDQDEARGAALLRACKVLRDNPDASDALLGIAMRQAVVFERSRHKRWHLVGQDVLSLDEPRDEKEQTTLEETLPSSVPDDGSALISYLQEALIPVYFESIKHRYQGYESPEIARALGIKENTVIMRYKRARKICQGLLFHGGEE